MLFFIGLIILAVPAIIALLIALGVSGRLKKAGNKRAKLFTVLTFIGCFLILAGAVLYGLSFIRLER
jgi:hypothetical protein